MKEGWSLKRLGDICVFDKRFNGLEKGTQKKVLSFKHVSAEKLKSLKCFDGDIRLLSTGYFDGYTTLDRAEGFVNSGEVICFPSGGSANLKYYKGEFVDSGNILMSSISSDVNLRFVYYYLVCINNVVESLYKGTGIKHPYMPDVYNLMIPLPLLEEQNNIVEYLDSSFGKLDSLKSMAKENLDNAQTLFQRALNDMMVPRDEWDSVRLDTICEIQSGFAFKSSDFSSEKGTFQVIRMGNVRPGQLKLSEKPVFLKNANSNCLEKSLLKIGDIIITQTGTRHKRDYGYTAIVDEENLLLNQRLARIRVSEKISNRYLLYHTWGDIFRDQFFANEGGTVGQGNVGMEAIKGNIIKLPPISEQEKIVVKLDKYQSNIRRLQQIYTTLSQESDNLKQSLLRKVFE